MAGVLFEDIFDVKAFHRFLIIIFYIEIYGIPGNDDYTLELFTKFLFKFKLYRSIW